MWENSTYPVGLDGLTADSRFNNLYRINTGLEYVIDRYSQSFFHRIRFRGGYHIQILI